MECCNVTVSERLKRRGDGYPCILSCLYPECCEGVSCMWTLVLHSEHSTQQEHGNSEDNYAISKMVMLLCL